MLVDTATQGGHLNDIHRGVAPRTTSHSSSAFRSARAARAGPKQIKARQANAAAAEEKLAKAHADSKAARVAVDQKQLLLRSGEAKIFDLKNKLNTCHTNREYQALRDQILADEMANSVLSDEILEAMERGDTFKHTIAEAEQQVAKAKEDLVKLQQTVRVARGDLARRSGTVGEGLARSGDRTARRFPRAPISGSSKFSAKTRWPRSKGKAAADAISSLRPTS